MIENQIDMEKKHSKEEKEILSHTHAHLKPMEADLIKTHQHIKELQKTDHGNNGNCHIEMIICSVQITYHCMKQRQGLLL